jgi:hypothetical protein
MRRDRKLWSSSSDELDEFDADPYPLLAGAYRSAGGEKNVVLERTRLLDRRVSASSSFSPPPPRPRAPSRFLSNVERGAACARFGFCAQCRA